MRLSEQIPKPALGLLLKLMQHNEVNRAEEDAVTTNGNKNKANYIKITAQ